MTKENKIDITAGLKRLEEIVEWFKDQKDVDVEAGLEKAKEALPILKGLKERIEQAENEFEEIKKELGEEEK